MHITSCYRGVKPFYEIALKFRFELWFRHHDIAYERGILLLENAAGICIPIHIYSPKRGLDVPPPDLNASHHITKTKVLAVKNFFKKNSQLPQGPYSHHNRISSSSLRPRRRTSPSPRPPSDPRRHTSATTSSLPCPVCENKICQSQCPGL